MRGVFLYVDNHIDTIYTPYILSIADYQFILRMKEFLLQQVSLVLVIAPFILSAIFLVEIWHQKEPTEVIGEKIYELREHYGR